MVEGEIGAPPRTFCIPSPETLVAMITSSRRPDFSIQPPMIRSVSPCVSFDSGVVGYISAVSMKLMPWSSAMSICACPSAAVFCVPQVMEPRHNALTFRSGAAKQYYISRSSP